MSEVFSYNRNGSEYSYCQFFASLFFMVIISVTNVWAESQSTQLVIPKEVEIKLTSKEKDGKRVAVLIFSAVVAPDIWDGRASELKLMSRYTNNKLFIEILGADFTPNNPPSLFKGYTLLVANSSVFIAEDWLTQPYDKEIVVVLRGKESRFSITYSGYQVTLTRLQKESIVKFNTWRPAAPSDSRSVLLWPADVAVLYVAGEISTNPEIDIRQDLIIFARAHGYLPADEVYRGLPQPKKQQLFIVRKEPLSRPDDASKLLGTLPLYSKYSNTYVYIRPVLDFND